MFEAIRCALVQLSRARRRWSCSTTCTGPTTPRSSCSRALAAPLRELPVLVRGRLPLRRARARAPAPAAAHRAAARRGSCVSSRVQPLGAAATAALTAERPATAAVAGAGRRDLRPHAGRPVLRRGARLRAGGRRPAARRPATGSSSARGGRSRGARDDPRRRPAAHRRSSPTRAGPRPRPPPSPGPRFDLELAGLAGLRGRRAGAARPGGSSWRRATAAPPSATRSCARASTRTSRGCGAARCTGARGGARRRRRARHRGRRPLARRRATGTGRSPRCARGARAGGGARLPRRRPRRAPGARAVARRRDGRTSRLEVLERYAPARSWRASWPRRRGRCARRRPPGAPAARDEAVAADRAPPRRPVRAPGRAPPRARRAPAGRRRLRRRRTRAATPPPSASSLAGYLQSAGGHGEAVALAATARGRGAAAPGGSTCRPGRWGSRASRPRSAATTPRASRRVRVGPLARARARADRRGGRALPAAGARRSRWPRTTTAPAQALDERGRRSASGAASSGQEHVCLSCMAYVLRELGDWDAAARPVRRARRGRGRRRTARSWSTACSARSTPSAATPRRRSRC